MTPTQLLTCFRKWRWRRRWPLYVKGCWYCNAIGDAHTDVCPVRKLP